MTIEEYWEQVCRLNGQINEKLLQATRLRGEGILQHMQSWKGRSTGI